MRPFPAPSAGSGAWGQWPWKPSAQAAFDASWDHLGQRLAAALSTQRGGDPAASLNRIRASAGRGPVTVLTATMDLSLSQAAVLAEVLRHDA